MTKVQYVIVFVCLLVLVSVILWVPHARHAPARGGRPTAPNGMEIPDGVCGNGSAGDPLHRCGEYGDIAVPPGSTLRIAGPLHVHGTMYVLGTVQSCPAEKSP